MSLEQHTVRYQCKSVQTLAIFQMLLASKWISLVHKNLFIQCRMRIRKPNTFDPYKLKSEEEKTQEKVTKAVVRHSSNFSKNKTHTEHIHAEKERPKIWDSNYTYKHL